MCTAGFQRRLENAGGGANRWRCCYHATLLCAVCEAPDMATCSADSRPDRGRGYFKSSSSAEACWANDNKIVISYYRSTSHVWKGPLFEAQCTSAHSHQSRWTLYLQPHGPCLELERWELKLNFNFNSSWLQITAFIEVLHQAGLPCDRLHDEEWDLTIYNGCTIISRTSIGF